MPHARHNKASPPGNRGSSPNSVPPQLPHPCSLEWLRLRKQYLMSQLAIADSQMAHVVGPDNSNSVHDPGFSNNGEPLALPRKGSGGPQRGSVDVRAGGDGMTGEGVDAEGHFILGLSAEGFGSTPVDEVRSTHFWHT